jgi:hypothetical protein
MNHQQGRSQDDGTGGYNILWGGIIAEASRSRCSNSRCIVVNASADWGTANGVGAIDGWVSIVLRMAIRSTIVVIIVIRVACSCRSETGLLV